MRNISGGRAGTATVTVAVAAAVLASLAGCGTRTEVGIRAAPEPAGPVGVLVQDDAGDVPTSLDVLRVRVDNGAADPDQVRVRVVQGDVRYGDELKVFFDTRAGNPGPERMMTGPAASEWTLVRMQDWDRRGRELSCSGTSMRIGTETEVSRVVVPRSCLGGNVDEVAVAVRVTRYASPYVDWVADVRTFLPTLWPAD